MSVELKPCAHCGSTTDAPIERVVHLCEFEIDYDDGFEGRTRWTVQCDGCTATMGHFETPEEAIEAWNTRGSGDLKGLVEALVKCRDKFLFYEQLHRLKCSSKGDEKADRNREMADLCDDAIAPFMPPGGGR